MNRSLFYALPFVLLAPACRTAGPAIAPATAPDPLSAYVGELRLLRHQANQRRIRSDGTERDGTCVVAVRVRAASLTRGAAHFSLDTVGAVASAGRGTPCRRMQPELDLVVSGFGADADRTQVKERVDGVLQTPEGYLASRGVRFELAPAAAPAEAACREPFATAAESALARRVTTWPAPLLAVDVWHRDPGGRVRHEGEIELDAVVGSDGRLQRPRLKTALSEPQRDAVLRSLTLWRFTPASGPSGPLPARIALRPILHIY